MLSSAKRFHAIACGCVLVLALALRLGFVWETHQLAEYRTPPPGLDIDLYWQAATELRHFDTERPQFALMMISGPGGAALLAVGQRILGESVARHRAAQAVIGAATLALLYWVSVALTANKWSALLSTLFAALLSSLIYFQSMLLKPGIEFLLLTALIAAGSLALRSVRRPISLGGLLGLLLAALLSSQQSTAPYVIVISGFIAVRHTLSAAQRWKILLPMWALVAVALFCLPRLGALVDSRYPLFLPTGGVHVNIGFHHGASGAYDRLEGVPSFPYGHSFVSRMQAEIAVGHRLSPGESDTHYHRRARNFIVEHPTEAAVLVWRKFRLFFNNFEAKANQSFDRIRMESDILRWSPLGFGALVVLSVWGTGFFWSSGRRAELLLLLGLVGAVLAANLATFVTWRYRIHAVVPLLILSGAGVVFLVDHVRLLWHSGIRRLGSFGARIVLPGIAACGLAFLPVDGALREQFLRSAEANAKRSEHAERLKAWLASSTVSPSTARRRIRVLTQLHEHTQAFSEIERLVKDSPADAWTNAQYLKYVAWLDERGEANRFVEELEERDLVLLRQTLQIAGPMLQTWLAMGSEAPRALREARGASGGR